MFYISDKYRNRKWCQTFVFTAALVSATAYQNPGHFGLGSMLLGYFGQFWGWEVSVLVGELFPPIFVVGHFRLIRLVLLANVQGLFHIYI